MELILHLGAHRTGSTALEQTLSANAPLLASEGTVIWKPAVLRRLPGFAQGPNSAAHPARLSAARAAFHAASGATGAATLVLSEENMPGTIGANLRAAALYPDVLQRLAAYATILGPPPRRIGLGLRSYAAFWVSCYLYLLRRSTLPTFDSLAPALIANAAVRGWPEVVEDIRTAFPQSEILVWPAEAIPGQGTLAAACALIGRDGTGMQPGPATVNAGLPAASIPVIHRLRANTPDLAGDALDARLAAYGPLPAYAPFAPAQQRDLDDRYSSDLDRLAHMPGVTLFAPQTPAGSTA